MEGEHDDSMGTNPARAIWVVCCSDGKHAVVFLRSRARLLSFRRAEAEPLRAAIDRVFDGAAAAERGLGVPNSRDIVLCKEVGVRVTLHFLDISSARSTSANQEASSMRRRTRVTSRSLVLAFTFEGRVRICTSNKGGARPRYAVSSVHFHGRTLCRS